MLEFDIFEAEFAGEGEDRSVLLRQDPSFEPRLALRLLTVAESEAERHLARR